MVVAEIFCRLFSNYFSSQELNLLSSQNESRGKYYCDSYHKNILGQELAKQCWIKDSKNFSTKNKKIWVLGGSTSAVKECDIVDEIWIHKIFADEYDRLVKNFSEENMTNDMQIKAILKNLEHDTPHMIIFSMLGTPELQFYGDERDRNYNKLLTQKSTIRHPNQDYLVQTAMFTIKISKTLERYFYSYKMLVVPLLRLNGRLLDYFNFLKREGEKAFESTPWDKAMVLKSNFAPIRYMLSSDSLKYAIENYRLNLEEISKISRDKKIEMVCVLHPYSRNFNPSYPYLGLDFIKWLDAFHNESKSLCLKYGFKVIDMRQCFIDKELSEVK
jgi:hypothetical protein